MASAAPAGGRSAETKAAARQEFRLHWKMVMAASLGFAFFSVMAAGMGLFIGPLGEEFGWSRTLLSSGLSIASFVTFLLSPLFGVLIDRWGSRRMAIPGLAASAVCVAAFSLLTGSEWQWIGLWVIYALISLTVKSTVWTVAVSSVFTAGRGLALGLTLSGTAVAQTITPPLANFLIEEFGWRQAFVWLGLGWGSIALLVCFLFLYDGHDLRKQAAAEAIARGEAPPEAPGLTIAQAWRSIALWRIAISTFLMMVITIALVVHQFPILTEAGVDRTSAALYSSVAGVMGIVGKLVTGWLLDRYHARWVGSLTLGGTAIAFGLLLLPDRGPAIILFAMAVNGYCSGTKLQIAGYLTAVYSGMRNYGAIFGTMASLIAAGSGLGPLVGGIVYDWYGSYAPFLVFGVVVSVFCGWLIYGVGKYPDWERREA